MRKRTKSSSRSTSSKTKATSSSGSVEPAQSAIGYWRLWRRAFATFKPPPRRSISQWADEERYLSKEAHSTGGKFRTSFAPYQSEPMDSALDQSVQDVCLRWASQVGKTELINNIAGYFIAEDPSPILMIQPTLDMAETWSKDRLAPMIRDTPAFHGLVKDARSRDSGNTLLMKNFPGGSIAVAGANSPAGLASRPRRVVLQDEIDRFPGSAGTEGDPCDIADKRAESFWNAVFFKSSTPTTIGLSRIDKEWDESDQRYWFVPCPQCHEHQTLKWAQVQWPKDEPHNAYYVCEHCKAELTDQQRIWMVRNGEWRPTAPFKGKRGYHLNGIYSPFKPKKGFRSRLHQMAAQFLDAKHKGKESIKVWTNTFLAESWQDDADYVSASPLIERREDYGEQLPEGVLIITFGVDVQDDRLEAEKLGWGLREETWALEYRQFFGSPELSETWDNLREWLEQPMPHPAGVQLKPMAGFIDSGFKPGIVYQFTRRHQMQRWFACKGVGGDSTRPLVGRPTKNNSERAMVFPLGSDSLKEQVYSRLKIEEPGPGYCHFPRGCGYDEEFFFQLTSERVVPKKRYGFTIPVWEPTRDRNEALDIRCYAVAAFRMLDVNLEKQHKKLWAHQQQTSDPEENKEDSTKPRSPVRKRTNWVRGWKRF